MHLVLDVLDGDAEAVRRRRDGLADGEVHQPQREEQTTGEPVAGEARECPCRPEQVTDAETSVRATSYCGRSG